MEYNGPAGEYLNVDEITSNKNCYLLKERKESCLILLWFESDDSIIEIDDQKHYFKKNEIVFLTEFHSIVPIKVTNLKMVRFNRSFYCIKDHDSEVSCKGLLFFGANQLPIICLKDENVKKFTALWEVLVSEIESVDSLQLEMLQMILKRLLILSTRIYKQGANFSFENESQLDLVREFNYLVELHFKEKHTVAEYAELLNKSPKTVSNLFKKHAAKSPLQYIMDRRLLEARRLLKYTDQSVKEIAYSIGFNDLQTFSRFFKKNEGVSPSDFKEKI